jgi:hypothetical protein
LQVFRRWLKRPKDGFIGLDYSKNSKCVQFRNEKEIKRIKQRVEEANKELKEERRKETR